MSGDKGKRAAISPDDALKGLLESAKHLRMIPAICEFDRIRILSLCAYIAKETEKIPPELPA